MERSKQNEVGSLEASLLKMVNDHNETSMELREETDKAKKDAIRIARRVSDLLMESVNGGVQEAFLMQKKIEMETRVLVAAVLQFGKQTDRWLSASRAINTAIKEIGDFENWMKTMELDCRSIAAAIQNIHQA